MATAPRWNVTVLITYSCLIDSTEGDSTSGARGRSLTPTSMLTRLYMSRERLELTKRSITPLNLVYAFCFAVFVCPRLNFEHSLNFHPTPRKTIHHPAITPLN